jgi:hypothetical protein
MITRRRFFGVLAAPFVAGLGLAATKRPIVYDVMNVRVFFGGQEITGFVSSETIEIDYTAVGSRYPIKHYTSNEELIAIVSSRGVY